MSEEKQIEDIQKALIKISEQPIMIEGLLHWSDVIAEELYNAGCRKQIEGEWIFEAHYFYDDYGDLCIYATAKCSECKKAYTNPHSTVASMRVSRPENLSEYDDWNVDVEPFLNEILEMARARKDLSKYCPNCGARMSGGKNE